MLTQISKDLLKQFQVYFQETVHHHLSEFEILDIMLGYQMGWNDVDGNSRQGNGGKQLRPLLNLLSCAALSNDPTQTLPLAAGIELIHTFSLIHDDFMDNSDTRRGQPSVWNVWGVNQAINAGDGAYGLSFELLANAQPPQVDASQLLKASAMLGKACVDTVQGQMMDIEFENREIVGVDEYVMMTGLKTGPLIGLALGGGALLADANLETVHALDKIGRTLGVAFQIQDDILGIWGDPTQTGKSDIDDLVQKKKSLPVQWALEKLPDEPRQILHDIYHMPAPLSLETVKQISDILTAHDVKAIVEAQAQAYYQEVVDGLTEYYPESDYKTELLGIVEFIVQRSH